jgi:hypothetical protein
MKRHSPSSSIAIFAPIDQPRARKYHRSRHDLSDQVRICLDLKSAKALGLNMPPTLSAIADQVIE